MRRLLLQTEERLVFRQALEVVTGRAFPLRVVRVRWGVIAAVAVPFLAGALLAIAGAIVGPRAWLVVAAALMLGPLLVGLRHRRLELAPVTYVEAAQPAPPPPLREAHVVRFDRTTQTISLIGPVREHLDDSGRLASLEGPVVAQVRLSAARLLCREHRYLPWSDVYEPGDEMDALQLVVHVASEQADLAGEYDLLYDLADPGWAVARTPVTERRRALAEAFFAAPTP